MTQSFDIKCLNRELKLKFCFQTARFEGSQTLSRGERVLFHMESREGQYHGGKQITPGVQHKMEGCAEARKNIPPTRVFCKPTEDKGQVSD